MQLKRIVEALDPTMYCMHTVTTNRQALRDGVCDGYIADFSRDDLWKVVVVLPRCLWYVVKFSPQYVISTGALPGLCMLFVAKILGKKTVWVDSVANFENLSMSGRLAKHFSDLWCTQWEHLPKNYPGLKYIGRVV